MDTKKKMGELFFVVEAQKVKEFLVGATLLSFGVFVLLHIITNYNELTFNALAIFSIVLILCCCYGISNLLNVFMRKIFFYSKGMVVISCFQEDVILMSDIKNLKIDRYGDDNMLLIFRFEMKDGKKIVIDGRNYIDFTLNMKKYGEKLNLDWSFSHI